MFKGPISLISLSFIIAGALAFSGCAHTQMKTQNEQIESRVTDLEKNLQAKDAEIVDLQYQVKDLSSKVDTSKSTGADQASGDSQSSTDQGEAVKISDMSSSSQIIRVKASPEKIQRALQAAGVYTGQVDGKIGSGTKAAIIEFQKSHGLKPDGVLGKRTWDVLKVYLK